MRGWTERRGIIKGHKETLEGPGYVIILTVMISWAYTYVKPCQSVHFKFMQFIIC